MKKAASLWLLVAVSYLTARYAVRVLTGGIWTIDRELLAHIAIVPASQVAVLELLRRTIKLRLPWRQP